MARRSSPPSISARRVDASSPASSTATGSTLDVVHRFDNGIAEQRRSPALEHHRPLRAGARRARAARRSLPRRRVDRHRHLGRRLRAARRGRTSARRADRVPRRIARPRVVDAVHARVGVDELYAINGLQFLPFNSIYQLAAEPRGPRWSRVAHVVLLPDLLAYWLTGELRTEYTNATTTGLRRRAHAATGRPTCWTARDPRTLLPPIEPPGSVRGPIRPSAARDRTRRRRRSSPRSARTTPRRPSSPFPRRTATSRTSRAGRGRSSGSSSTSRSSPTRPQRANFTNEGGVDDRIRLLRNVGGLWLLQECLRAWRDRAPTSTSTAARRRRSAARRRPEFDVDDPSLVAPGDMPARIAASSRRRRCRALDAGRDRALHRRLPRRRLRADDRAGRALAARDVERACTSSAAASQNALLCQLTAELARTTGHRRAGRGNRARQRARAGPRPRRGPCGRSTSSTPDSPAPSDPAGYDPS